MQKHQDPLFEMFRESFSTFSPEAPKSAYSGIRRKLFWSEFLGFNFASLNIWYLSLILAGGLTAAWAFMPSQCAVSPAQQLDVLSDDYRMAAVQEFQSENQTIENQNVLKTAAQVQKSTSTPLASKAASTQLAQTQASVTGGSTTTEAVETGSVENEVRNAEMLLDVPEIKVDEIATQAQSVRMPILLDRASAIEGNLYEQLQTEKEKIILDFKVTLPKAKEE